VSNSFATSVGSGAISLRGAVIIAAVMVGGGLYKLNPVVAHSL
jgi:phosphate/sulfate permease